MGKDYYETLGVDKNATKQEIKKAYKKLALKFHPDRAPDDKKKEYEEHFKEINEAASVLGDEQKRQHYDQFGTAEPGVGGAGGFGGFDYSDFAGFGEVDLGDLFDSFFGGGGGGGGTAPLFFPSGGVDGTNPPVTLLVPVKGFLGFFAIINPPFFNTVIDVFKRKNT